MIPQLCVIVLILTSTSVFAQFGIDSVRPDVTFNEDNDRFDITSMIQDANRMYYRNQAALAEEESRRNLKSNEEQNGILGLLTGDSSRKSGRRFDNDFAYHDRMDSHEGGTVAEFEQNLKHFMNEENLKKHIHGRRMMEYVKHLHGDKKPSRRSRNSANEKDLLMHYAVPFVLNVDGFMKMPLQ